MYRQPMQMMLFLFPTVISPTRYICNVKLSHNQYLHLRSQLIHRLAEEEVSVLLDSNQCQSALGIGRYELLAAWQPVHQIAVNERAFSEWSSFLATHKQCWIFGAISYDAKNDVENLTSLHPDCIGFPVLHFFVPESVIAVDKQLQVIEGAELVKQILDKEWQPSKGFMKVHNLNATVSYEKYCTDVQKIIDHIIQGDVYELNYCMQWQAHTAKFDTAHAYTQLLQKSPVPFGAFYRYKQSYLLCASPERFLCKYGHTLYSQPIKGTTRRGVTAEEDDYLKNNLQQSEKERAENLMIVDLVRNDLARSAVTGTVSVDELFGIYSYAQVHQMISTVSACVNENYSCADMLKNAFPMGSMTGAPKIKSMQLIEEYECTRRGLYSGTVGYISPDGDFDFNVVIRSLQYNAVTGTLAFNVGSAITFDSVADEEYNECLLKAKAITELLHVNVP